LNLPWSFELRFGDWDLVGERFAARHVPGVLALERVCFPQPWSEELLLQEARPRNYAWNMVVLIEERVQAFFFNWTVLSEMHLLNFAVHPDLQRQGLGGFLLDWMLDEARSSGYHSVSLEVRESNKPAIGLYESRGFEILFRRKGYYTDNGEDALIMSREKSSAHGPAVQGGERNGEGAHDES